MRLSQAHDTRDGPHRPNTCGACDRALAEGKPHPGREYYTDEELVAVGRWVHLAIEWTARRLIATLAHREAKL